MYQLNIKIYNKLHLNFLILVQFIIFYWRESIANKIVLINGKTFVKSRTINSIKKIQLTFLMRENIFFPPSLSLTTCFSINDKIPSIIAAAIIPVKITITIPPTSPDNLILNFIPPFFIFFYINKCYNLFLILQHVHNP